MLTLSRVGPHEWRFEYPPIFRALMNEFHAGCELYEVDAMEEAETLFRSTLAQMPDHLDALHYLALVLSEREETEYAQDLWSLAVVIGHMAFPPDFESGVDRLEWQFLDNRPFLRCLHGLALTWHERGETEKALGFTQELLSLSPNDNLGIRAVALEELFALGRWEDAFQLTQRYHGDIFPETLYGRALALFRLGRPLMAMTALEQAVKSHPRVKAELLKASHRRPKSKWPGRLEVGGADEAYEYWKSWGRFWKEAPTALTWLESVEKQPKTGD